MNHKQTKKMESGHSMIEMLGVLMIMGLLGITMVVGIRIALNKLKASQIIKDARLSHTMLLTNIQRQEESIDWRDVLFTSNSGKYVQNRFRDEQAQTKVIEVEQAVCEELMGFSEGAKFYTLDAAGLHPLESCAENQDMVIILDMAQGEEVATGCVTKDDCTNGWCNEGTCVTCPEGETPNEAGTGCTIFCNEDQYTCYDDQNRSWCCPNPASLGCPPEFGKCPTTDDKCSWTFTQEPLKADCAWRFTQTPAQSNCAYEFSQGTAESDCSYTFSQETAEADCSYTFSQDPRQTDCSINISYNAAAGTATLTSHTGCPTGQYCNIYYSTDDCNSSVTSTSTGTLYGVCNRMGTTNTACVPGVHMNAQKRCGENQYCNIYHSSSDCMARPGSNSTGVLYGVCNNTSTTNTTCLPKIHMNVNQGCGENQYCYIAFTDPDCNTTSPNNHAVQNGSTGTLYGVCNAMETRNTTCLPGLHMDASEDESLRCPEGQYCYIAFIDPDCNTSNHAVQHGSTGTLYGVCNAMTTENKECIPGVQMEAVTGCDAGQYCNIYHANEACGSRIASNSVDLMYGVCNRMGTTNSDCVPEVSMKANTYCPRGQYCFLKWAVDDTSCTYLSSNSTGEIYGVCLSTETSSTYCPYK